ncbi:MAG: HD domain-containing protein [Terrisporobacter sp.]|uniref:HD domain-containing protein n=1 Tax=Terrisporobacter sp. TaxID=1965305 RepID=UPI002FCBAE04
MENEIRLLKAIKSNNVSYEIIKLDQSKILEEVIPKVKGMKEVGKCKYHVVDCFQHTIYALEEFERLIKENKFPSHLEEFIWQYLNREVEADLKVLDLLKLSVFLHDVGKADAKTIDDNGRTHFKGHEKFSGLIAKELGEKLNLCQEAIDLIYKFTSYHMYLLYIYKNNDASEELLYKMFEQLNDEIIGVMLLGYADITATKRLLEPRENEEILKTYMNYILTNYLYKYKK